MTSDLHQEGPRVLCRTNPQSRLCLPGAMRRGTGVE